VAVPYRRRLFAESAEHQLDRQGLGLGVRVEDAGKQAAVDVGLERKAQGRCGLAGGPSPAAGGADRIECDPSLPQQDLTGGCERNRPRGQPLLAAVRSEWRLTDA
jgi:hypothetical protein